MSEYGYVTTLSEDVPNRVEALKVGKFAHPVYGSIEITPERLQNFAASVNDKVRGIDPDIDYAHKARTDEAAGWIKSASVEGDSLFVEVDWTAAAQQKIKDKEFRYFSSEIWDEWEDADGKKHVDVLAGGGLTNRPFMKNLTPLNFDEFYRNRDASDIDIVIPVRTNDNPEGGNELDPKKLAELLGIDTEDEAKLLSEVKSLHEFRATKLTEAEKAKAFADQYPDEAKRLQELEGHNKLMETDTRISEWTHKGLPPVLFEDEGENKSLGLREFRMSLDKDQAAKFDELVAKVIETGVQKFDATQEIGGNGDPAANADVAARFETVIKKFQDDDKLSYADAVKAAENAEPELAKAYMAGEGVS